MRQELAIQMPDNWLEPTHVSMREVAVEQGYPNRGREPLPGVHAYYDILTEAGCDVDIWRTTYFHKMGSHQAIIDWVSARKCQQYLPVFLKRILLFQQFMVALQELLLLAFIQLL